MLDGLQYEIAQVAIVVAVAAVLAGILGWLIGRASGKRRAAKALVSTPVSRLHAAPAAPALSHTPTPVDASPAPAAIAHHAAYAPTALVAEPFAPTPYPVDVPGITQPTPDAVDGTATTIGAAHADAANPVAPEPAVEPASLAAEAAPMLSEPVVRRAAGAPTHAYDEPSDDEDDEEDDPDRTVLRPAPSWTAPSKTPEYAPPRFTVISSALPESELVQRTASVQEVQELRRELRTKELELGTLEAGALSAWDRTVPVLEAQISDLQDENASLRRQLREAEEHSDADAQTVERLRASIAERDARLAEIRAQG